MIEVLLLCEYSSLNGGERSMLSVLDRLDRRQFRLACAAPAEGPLRQALEDRRIEVLPLVLTDAAGRTLSLAERRERLEELLRRRRPDLVHANSLSIGRIAGPVVRGLGLTGIAHLRDIVGLSAAAAADLNANRRLIAVSRAVADFHAGQGVEAARIEVMYNGVDLETFAPCPPSGYLHREWNLPDRTRFLLSVGQIGMRKGTDVALAAFERLARRREEIHLLIVGLRHSQKDEAVRFEQSLHRRVAEAGLDGRVHFLGSRDDVPRMMNEAAILIHAARQEPLGRVLLEAAAAGLPVAATDVGGTAEIFPPETGAALLVPPDDAPLLTEAAERLLSDEALARRTAKAARIQAESRFDVRRAAERLAEVYRRCAEER